MSKYQFMNEVTQCLSRRPEVSGCSIEGKVYYRNNDTQCYGITISRSDEHVSPVFYVDRYYDKYCKKKQTADETADEMIGLMKRLESDRRHLSEISLCFEDCKDRITYRLISAKRNENYLDKVVHVPFLDLAIVFTVVVEQTDSNVKSIRITEELMEEWGTSTRELMELARVNTPRIFPPRFQTLSSLMREFFGMPEDDGSDGGCSPLLLLSNKDISYGATSILYEDTMHEIADNLGEDFYVIPSSIHEVLIMPETYVDSVDEINSMIKEINQSHVGVGDILSDQAYLFKKNENRFYF